MTTQPLRRLAALATISLALVACSTSTDAGTAPGTSGASTAATPAANTTGCAANPATAPVPTAEPYEAVPADARVSLSLSGIPSGTLQPGAAPVEVEVTMCNNSPVAYPKVGIVLALERCSCAPNPISIPQGVIERFDPATQTWIKLDHPAMGTGMDYLGGYTNEQHLPKGKKVTVKYRVALDPSMTDGKGGLEAVAVTTDPLNQIGRANLAFTATKTPSATPPPDPRQSVVPLQGVTSPFGLATGPSGDAFIADQNRVLKVAAGSNEQSDVPFTGLTGLGGIAVDTAGNVYVTNDKKVLKWTAATGEQTVLPFTGLENPQHLAVDPEGNVYVADGQRVVGLAAGIDIQAELPFTGLAWVRAIAADKEGNVYANDGAHQRVVKLMFNTDEQTVLPLSANVEPDGLAVDEAGNVFVVDTTSRQIAKLAAGSGAESMLPISGLSGPQDVTVDGAGNVYVLDGNGFGQLVKLAAG
jgi:streptogramin lyase